MNIKTILLLDSRDPSKWRADEFSLYHIPTQTTIHPDIVLYVRRRRAVIARFNQWTSFFWGRFLFMPLWRKLEKEVGPVDWYFDYDLAKALSDRGAK